MNREYTKYISDLEAPVDFDKFYDELKSKSKFGKIEIKESKEFNIDGISINDLTFETDDKASIYAKYVYPTKKPIKGVILNFHGYHVHSGAWFDKIAYASLGYAILAMDVRGQSGKSVDVSQTKGSTLKGLLIKGIHEGHENLYYTQVFMDTYRLANIAKSLYPNNKLICMGESQGGALALVCAALCEDISKCVINYPYLCDIEHAYDLGSPYAGIEDYFMWEDPQGLTRKYFFDEFKYIDIQFFAKRIKADVHMLVGEKDKVCPPICQFAMFNRLKCKKEVYFYPLKGHDYLEWSEDVKLKAVLGGK